MPSRCRHRNTTVDMPMACSSTVHLKTEHGHLRVTDTQRTELEIAGTLVITCQDCGYYLRWNLEAIDDAPMWAGQAAKKATGDFLARQAIRL